MTERAVQHQRQARVQGERVAAVRAALEQSQLLSIRYNGLADAIASAVGSYRDLTRALEQAEDDWVFKTPDYSQPYLDALRAIESEWFDVFRSIARYLVPALEELGAPTEASRAACEIYVTMLSVESMEARPTLPGHLSDLADDAAGALRDGMALDGEVEP